MAQDQNQITFSPAGPVARAFMQDDSFVRVLIGPIGSGKTSAAVVEILRRASMQRPGPDGVRRVRVACIRNTFSDLKTTTIKSWNQWCPAAYGKLTLGTSPIVHHIRTEDLDLEVLFVPLNDEADVRKLLSLELTMAWIDEAREVPREILDALTGRVGRYPSRLAGGCTWSGIILTSNPGDTESWLFKLSSNPPDGFKVFRQPSGRSAEAENLENLPTDYYKRIAAGKDSEWLKVYCDGEFGFVMEGSPVYPSFRDSVHVAKEKVAPLQGIGLVLGADWGLTPACVIAQQWPDGRIHILDEFVTESSGIVRFAAALTAHMRQHYPGFDVVAAVGDPSGNARGHDERTVFEIMNANSPWRWRPATTNDPDLRIESVTAALNRMVDGKPGFVLSPSCPTLRKGFSGGYHYRRVHSGAAGPSFHEAPAKNHYSHIHDSLQYALLAMGGAEAVLHRGDRSARPRIAEGIDFTLLDRGEETTRTGTGVRFGNPPYRDRERQQRRVVFAREEDGDEW